MLLLLVRGSSFRLVDDDDDDDDDNEIVLQLHQFHQSAIPTRAPPKSRCSSSEKQQ